jgi:hypothetical protein
MPTALRAVVAAFLLAQTSACKDSSGPTIFDPVGTWSGTTNQGRTFGFTVTASGVTSGTISYHLDGTGCSYDADVTVGGGAATPVNNNRFTVVIDLTSSFGATFTINGTFTSNTAANGTATISDSDCNGTANLTWTATKQ